MFQRIYNLKKGDGTKLKLSEVALASDWLSRNPARIERNGKLVWVKIERHSALSEIWQGFVYWSRIYMQEVSGRPEQEPRRRPIGRAVAALKRAPFTKGSLVKLQGESPNPFYVRTIKVRPIERRHIDHSLAKRARNKRKAKSSAVIQAESVQLQLDKARLMWKGKADLA